MAQQDHPPTALAGLKVLDLSRILAGPSATQLFAADILPSEARLVEDKDIPVSYTHLTLPTILLV